MNDPIKRKKCFNKALKTVLNEAESRMYHSIDTHERDEEMRPGHPNEGKVPSELCGEDCWCREEMHPVYNSVPWDEDSRREFKYDAQEFIEMELNRYIGIAQSGESCICGEHPPYHRAK